MARTQYSLIIVVIAISGFVGGAISVMLFSTQQVKAEVLPEPQEIVTAEEFRLLDRAGRPRARLAVISGNPVFSLLDESGNARLMMALDNNDNPMLGLSDANNKTRTILGTARDGSPYLKFWDANEKLRVSLALIPEDTKDGSALVFSDKNGVGRILLATEKDGYSNLMLLDEAGNTLWRAH